MPKLRIGFRDKVGNDSHPFGQQLPLLNYEPDSGALRLGVTGGVRSGKTAGVVVLALRNAILNAKVCPGTTLALYGPILKTLKRVLLSAVLELFPPHHPGQPPLDRMKNPKLSPAIASHDHEAQEIILYGGLRILYGTFDSARAGQGGRDQGWECGVIVLTEAQQLSRGQRQRLVSRCSEDVPYRTIILEGLAYCGTTFEEWCKAPDVQWFKFKTADNPHLPADFKDGLTIGMSSDEELMYFDGEFIPQGSRVISGYSPKIGESLVDYRLDPARETRLFWDPGFNRPFVAAAQLIEGANWRGDQWVICHEWVNSNVRTEKLAKQIKVDLEGMGAWGSLVRIACDPAGKSASSRTGLETDIKDLKAIFKVPVDWPRVQRLRIVQEGCKMVNGLFLDAEGERRILVSSHLVEQGHLADLQRKQRVGIHQSLLGYGFPDPEKRADLEEPVKDNVYDHAIDALRYAVVCWRPREQVGEVKRAPLPEAARGGGFSQYSS